MRNLFISLLLVLGSALCMAEDAVITKVASLNKNRTSVQYNFQEKDFKKLKNTTKTCKGVLYFSGKKMSMIYSAPAGDKRVVANNAYSQKKDGKAMKMATTAKGPVTSLSHMLINGVAGNVQAILTENSAKAATSTEGNQYVVVISKDKGTMGTLKKLTLKYNKTSGVLEYLKMEYSTGDYNEYSIVGQPTLNKAIADDKFTHAK